MNGLVVALFAGIGALGVFLATRKTKAAPVNRPPQVPGAKAWRGTTFIESPHHSSRGGKEIKYIVIHYTAGGTGAASWFQNPTSLVSAHFVVTRSGSVIQCVTLDRAAWHAGAANIDGEMSVNAASIGIEIENWGRLLAKGAGVFTDETGKTLGTVRAVESGGSYWEQYTPEQIASVAGLVRDLRSDYPSIMKVVGHEEIAVPKGRKKDPGPLFPWSEVRT